jgi:Raf kinase inhibitor-like YbhB/YbcL family protein
MGIHTRVATVIVVLFLAGCSHGGAGRPEPAEAPAKGNGMELVSPAFADQATIPEQYTCDGTDISPPLELSGLPQATVSLALVMDDPDAMSGAWDHWVVFDIEPRASIPESVENLGTAGTNSWGRTDYGGPCPDLGVHRYFLTVYALDVELGLEQGASKLDVLGALEGHVLAEATLVGRYGH